MEIIMRKKWVTAFEFLIGIVFFAVVLLKGLLAATLALVIMQTLFILAVKLSGEKLTKFQILVWLTIVILGGASLLSGNESIIKWKPTLVMGVSGIILLLSHYIGQQTLLERILEGRTTAPQVMLRKVNFCMAVYALLVALANAYVLNNFSTETWNYFKFPGLLITNSIFIFGSIFYLKDHINELKNR